MNNMDENYTENDTFARLRKVDFEKACKIYFNSVVDLPLSAEIEELEAISTPFLRSVGWTFKELMKEARGRTSRYDSYD